MFHPPETSEDLIAQIFDRWTRMLWPSCLPWKPDAVNPMVGLFVFNVGSKWRWMPEPKSVMATGECRFSSIHRPKKSFQDFSSWIPPKVRMGILFSVWSKCKMQSSSDTEFAHSSLMFAWSLFRCHRYPAYIILTSLSDWAKRPRNGGGSPVMCDLIDLMCQLLEQGVFPPSVKRAMASLPSCSYIDPLVCFNSVVLPLNI